MKALALFLAFSAVFFGVVFLMLKLLGLPTMLSVFAAIAFVFTVLFFMFKSI